MGRSVEAQHYAAKYELGSEAPVTPHLAFIDGLRACAAVYVVLHHCGQFIWADGPSALPWWLTFGHSAVTVFIVISGFCLGLPVARSGRVLKGGALRFFFKRARRILPPYYVAFILGVVLWSAFRIDGAPHNLLASPPFRLAIILHLLLVHNLSVASQFLINGPLWSVATEVQIYLVFPLIVLIWRKFGSVSMLAATLVASLALIPLSRHIGSLHYLFVFTLGVLASGFSIRRFPSKYLYLLLLVSLAIFAVLPNKTQPPADFAAGVAAAVFMVLCTTLSFRPRLLLSTPILVWLGGFSYSLYLTHALTLILWFRLRPVHALLQAGGLQRVLILVVAPVVAIAVSYGFHIFIERPFITKHTPRLASGG